MIKENVRQILGELPTGVLLVAAAKSRSAAEVKEAADSGVKIIGENYVQETQAAFKEIGRRVSWHFIGHLQKNKVKKAVEIFDLIETIDSYELAAEVDKRCRQINKTMPVLIEINSGREEQKTGVLPERAEELVKKIAGLNNLRVVGLMTMGPYAGDPEEARPYFKLTKTIFDKLKASNIPGIEMKFLSMGMTNSYKIAIEEGANLVRLGTKIFGERGVK